MSGSIDFNHINTKALYLQSHENKEQKDTLGETLDSQRTFWVSLRTSLPACLL